MDPGGANGQTTIEIDLGDKESHSCVLFGDGEVLEMRITKTSVTSLA